MTALRQDVQRLPEAARGPAAHRLLPALSAAENHFARGNRLGATLALQEFVREVGALRLRAPYPERKALAETATCASATL